MPMVNQLELHPGYHQDEIVKFCKEKGMVIEAWSPMMQGKPVSALQAMLNAAGYTASDGQRLNVDGKLGKRSFSAFVEFLNAHKKYIE